VGYPLRLPTSFFAKKVWRVTKTYDTHGPMFDTALTAVSPVASSLVARTCELSRPTRAANTTRAYLADWTAFEAWCSGVGAVALPAVEGTLCLYVVHLAGAGRKHATILRAVAAIRVAHADAGQRIGELPHLRTVLGNLARETGTAPAAKAPLMAATLRTVVTDSAADTSVGAVRDRALLLLGFAGALRRSELVGLDVADLRFTDDGLEVTVRRGKTDQTGAGRVVGVPHGRKGSCPVRAVKAWLVAAGIEGGAVFRRVGKGGRVMGERLSGQAVGFVVKDAAAGAGLDPADFGGHSLRSGLATSAAKAGAGLVAVMSQGGWKSERIARRYIRHGSLFTANAAEGLL